MCGSIEKSQEVFDGLSTRNVVSWTILIGGYIDHGRYEESFGLLEKMHQEGISPNVLTHIRMLKACGCLGSIERGNDIHSAVVRYGLERELLVGNALIDMYARCGELAKAQKVLEMLATPDIVSWNTLIAGYAQCNKYNEAFNAFQKMQGEGLSPDKITYSSILKVCGNSKSIEKGEQILHSFNTHPRNRLLAHMEP